MTTKQVSTAIKENLRIVNEKIQSAAASAGRRVDSVRLVVVSKTHPIETIQAAIEVGVRDFGENYTDEGEQKVKAIGKVEGLTWHMIGHIQSRKAETVAACFDFVHTIDSLKLAARLNRFAQQNGRIIPVLMECNVSGEQSKAGYPAVNQSEWENLEKEARQIAELPNLEIRGLMTMPPLFDDGEKSRPYFRKLNDLRNFMAEKLPANNWNDLSMGTSYDYGVAVEEGATIVRVGTAILGLRPPKK